MVTRLPPKEKTAGSSPVRDEIFFLSVFFFHLMNEQEKTEEGNSSIMSLV